MLPIWHLKLFENVNEKKGPNKVYSQIGLTKSRPSPLAPNMMSAMVPKIPIRGKIKLKFQKYQAVHESFFDEYVYCLPETIKPIPVHFKTLTL